jgi:hypothetical protein
MMKAHILLVQLALVACLPAYVVSAQPDSCGYFFSALRPVPHDKLSRSEGAYKSLWDGKKYTGCEIQFVTNDKLLSGRRVPDFDPVKDSEMYRTGWRMNNSFVADGPGTGVFGVEKESVLCLVRHEQPAYLDDYGNIIQSETLRITVQCRYR